MKQYSYQILIAVDQFLNTLLGGYPDETLSSRIYRHACLKNSPNRRWVIAYKAVNGLFFWQDDHCLLSYRRERNIGHRPIFDE